AGAAEVVRSWLKPLSKSAPPPRFSCDVSAKLLGCCSDTVPEVSVVGPVYVFVPVKYKVLRPFIVMPEPVTDSLMFPSNRSAPVEVDAPKPWIVGEKADVPPPSVTLWNTTGCMTEELAKYVPNF